MSGLWMNDPKTSEGKYPIVLRRDGTPLQSRYFVMVLKDPATEAGLRAYADKAEELGYDPDYVKDLRDLADQCIYERQSPGAKADPCSPPHRVDNPIVLAWARSIGKPSV